MDLSKLNTANIKAVANVVIAIAALFLSGAISFPPGTSEATQHTILAWDGWILAVVAALNGVMHFMPDFTVPPSKETAKGSAGVIDALLIGALFIGALAIGAPSVARAASVPVTKSAPTTQAQAQSVLASLFSKIQTFTVADLQAALADANAQTPPDTRHGQCWAALIPLAQSSAVNPLPAGLGAAQGIQKVFDDVALFGSTQSFWKDTVATACALTELDLGTDLNGLLAKVGVAAIVLPKL
jgi:hypothetical protein